ncbi:MAG: hypothetical protein HOI65_11330, partial [Opitutae bacterium]|nr:hypothetical protein [Opitutae bacterium]
NAKLNLETRPAPRIALFNLSDDAGEKKNVASQHPDVSKKLAAQLDQFIKDGRSRPAN